MRYEAFVAKGWREGGIAYVFVVRRREPGFLDFGAFLVDLWCLGIKDAFGESDLPESEFAEYVEARLPEDERESIHPTCAKKLIEGAVTYAESIGFSPHRDFRKARRVLSGLDASLCPMDFTFGREGRPCYVVGEMDSEARVKRVLEILEARFGRDGFDFEDATEEEDDDGGIAELRADLIEFLANEPDDVPRFYHLSGLVTAAYLGAVPITSEQIIAAIWPEGRDWSEEEESDFRQKLQAYRDYIGGRVDDATPDDNIENSFVDVWKTDLPEQDEEEDYDALPFLVALVEWTAGFWRATGCWPEAWEDALERPDLAAHWEMVRWWSAFPAHKDQIDAAAEATPPHNIGLALKAIARALPRPPASRD